MAGPVRGGIFGFSALALVAALVPPLRRYFDEPNDVVSMLTIPVVPNLVYASMLAVVGVGLLRRLQGGVVDHGHLADRPARARSGP